MQKAADKIEYISYITGYAVAFFASRSGCIYLAGIVLILEALFLYVLNFQRTGSFVNLKGLFSLSWIGGEGLACFQLSRLQSDWENMTWLCFFLAYFCFLTGYHVWDRKYGTSAPVRTERQEHISGETVVSFRDGIRAQRILFCILGLAAASLFCFLLEAAVLGFIPLFSPEPHAYSYFHISGVHYITVSCILIPALSVLYFGAEVKWTPWQLAALAAANLLAVAVPILCVSRFQLLFAVGFAAVIYLQVYRHVTWKMVLAAFLILIPVYVLLTVARRHDISYLNGIFEMKYSRMPIFITQPYIYVVNNYENFNCMVAQLSSHSLGVRMLFPLFALTGIKFLFPQLTAFPAYTTKEELTTLTLFYDAYYDFGIVGIIFFAGLLGIAAAWLTQWVQKNDNPLSWMFYGQAAIYLGLSFFTTWFSNPTTWFWLGVTFVMYLFCGYKRKKEGNRLERWKLKKWM